MPESELASSNLHSAVHGVYSFGVYSSTVLALILSTAPISPRHFMMLITFDCDRPARSLMALRTGLDQKL